MHSKKYGKEYFYNSSTNLSQWERPKSGFVIYHILIKHSNSTRPNIHVSSEQAFFLAKKLKKQIETRPSIKEEFVNIAQKISKCSSSINGGYLGDILINEMQKEFETAAFKLKENEISEPIYTKSGIHLIYRGINDHV